jgi:hypothetical protein
MYKNFNLTDEERQQIMEQHKSHGYRKPINEAVETVAKPKKTDATSNPYWKQLGPKLKSLGFTEKLTRHKEKQPMINIGGYPDIDFVQSVMTHQSGIQVSYPYTMLDYTGDYYPDYVDISGMDMKNLKNPSCMGKPDESSDMKVKVQCMDLIYSMLAKMVRH